MRAGYRRIGSEHASWKGIAIEYSHPSHFVGRISRSSRLQIGRDGIDGMHRIEEPEHTRLNDRIFIRAHSCYSWSTTTAMTKLEIPKHEGMTSRAPPR